MSEGVVGVEEALSLPSPWVETSRGGGSTAVPDAQARGCHQGEEAATEHGQGGLDRGHHLPGAGGAAHHRDGSGAAAQRGPPAPIK